MIGAEEKKTESLLWEAFLVGDYSALGTLYTRCYDLLLNYGLKIYQDQNLVKDTIQDLFVKLYNSKDLKKTEFVRAYLLRALRNLLYDKLLTIRTHIEIDHNSFDIQVVDSKLEKLFEQNDKDLQKAQLLLTVYSKLPPNQKQIIYLRFVKGFSYKEISDILEIKVQSSMNLSQRALSAMREGI